MKAITLTEAQWGRSKHVRRRVRWEGGKTRRRMWWEFTNQPGDGDWIHGGSMYQVKTAPRGEIAVWVDAQVYIGHDATMLPPVLVERLTTDLVEVSVESRMAYNRRKAS